MLTQARLKEVLDYNPSTGIFIWKQRKIKDFKSIRAMNTLNSRYIGKESGTKRPDGYIAISIDKKTYLAHRLAWFYIYGYFPEYIDHVNMNKSDNRAANIRIASKTENGQNIKKCRSHNKTKLLGVSFFKRDKTFRARIVVNGVENHIGYFLTPKEAHNAYLVSKKELHPFSN